MLWARNPWNDAWEAFDLATAAGLGLVRASASPFTSPNGEVYWPMRIEVGEYRSVPSPEDPEVTLPMWETVDEFDAFLLYDASGTLVRCMQGSVPQRLVFTPDGTVFGLGVPGRSVTTQREFRVDRGSFTYLRSVRTPNGTVYGAGRDSSLLVFDPQGHGFISADAGGITLEQGGVAYRVFAADGLAFTLRRTIYLPGGAIYGDGPCGVYLVRTLPQGESPAETFAIYQEGASRALSFVIPEGHHFQDWDYCGHIYATRLTEDCLVVGAWAYP